MGEGRVSGGRCTAGAVEAAEEVVQVLSVVSIDIAAVRWRITICARLKGKEWLAHSIRSIAVQPDSFSIHGILAPHQPLIGQPSRYHTSLLRCEEDQKVSA